MNSKKLEKIKRKAISDGVPIIMDDTLEVIEKYMNGTTVDKILEIGTAVGYSALCFSKFLNNGGIIDTIERDEERIKEAQENIKILNELDDVGIKDKILHKEKSTKQIKILEGDAVEILPKLNDKYGMIFIDAAKGKYPFFLEQALRLLDDNGVIFADNILFKGYVMSDYNKHKQRTAVNHLREFIKMSTESPNLQTQILEVGDGLAIIKRK